MKANTKLHQFAGRLWLTLDGKAIGFTEARQRVAAGDARAPILRQYMNTERRRARYALATDRKIIPALQRYFAEVCL
tara:strand:+ start:363 stop:593 length:231 start_codon:yes stop_codon:yes gene_type:complete